MKTLPEKIDSKFRFVLLAATRTEQIMRGAQPKDPMATGKNTRIAMDEIRSEEVAWDYGFLTEAKVPEPIADDDGDVIDAMLESGGEPEQAG